MTKTYDQLNIYEATYSEVYEAVKLQYKNREHTDYKGRTLTVKDWDEINRNIRDDLREMDVKFKTAFYNPNNMRVYIKQSFRKMKFTHEGETVELTINSSDDYYHATWRDYCTDEEYFTVPAW